MYKRLRIEYRGHEFFIDRKKNYFFFYSRHRKKKVDQEFFFKLQNMQNNPLYNE